MAAGPATLTTVSVNHTHLAFRECGEGRPAVFVHGNPTSSYLWRHVMAAAPAGWRCLAPDLVGMGASGRPDLEYGLEDHVDHLTTWLDGLGVSDAAIVGHDWGAVLACCLLARRPDLVGALAVMEAHLQPLADWTTFDEGGRRLFSNFRTPGLGERLVLDENALLELVLPGGLQRDLAPEDLTEYRRHYPTPRSRRALLAWTRQIPIAGEPADVTRAYEEFAAALATSPVPKLLIATTPGAVLGPDTVEWARREWPALTVVDVAPAGHFVPEDLPDDVARAVWTWLGTCPPIDTPSRPF